MSTDIRSHQANQTNAIVEDLEILSMYDGTVASRFLKYISPYKKGAIIGVAAVIFFTLAVLSVPLLVKYAIDTAVKQGDGSLLNIIFFSLIGVALIHFVSNYFQQRIIREIGEKILFDIRTQMFAHLQKLSMSVADRSKYGSIMSRVLGDVGALSLIHI